MDKTKIAVFISGRGSNAIAIMQKEKDFNYSVSMLVSTKEQSPAIDYAIKNNIACNTLTKEEFKDASTFANELNNNNIEVVVLAGFLWKIPKEFIQAFSGKIINIHPALLPKYGGKGMYGLNIHKAVIENKEKESGITIHLVNENYDEGKILFQKNIQVDKEDTAQSLADKILVLEHLYFPKEINALCNSLKN